MLAWNIPYLRTPYFTGREDLLRQLHDNLTRNKAAALTQAQQPPSQQASQQAQAILGLGGIGKTQTAIEYAYRHQGEYRYILWTNAATLDTLIASFIELASLLKLPERDEKDQRIVVAAVRDWFATHNGWLAIFDNADDLALVEDYLPPGGRGHLLLTTRAQAPGALAQGLEVEKMDEHEGMLLLLRRVRVLDTDAPLEQAAPADREAATAVMRELDGLPLALDQAGAYIEETQCSITSYLEQYRHRHARLLQRRGGTGKQHPEPVATTWSLSFQKVEERDPIAAELLRFFAFLASDAIPEQLIIDGASELGPALSPLADDPSLLDEAIATLLRYSLVKRKREEGTISVHRLVQTILRESMDEPAQREWTERAVRAVNEAFPDVMDYRNWSLIRLFLPHAQTCAESLHRWKLEFREAGRLCNIVGIYLEDHARYAEAEKFKKRALAIYEKILDLEDPELATTLNNLAHLYTNQGQYEQAEPLFQRAIAIGEKALGPEHPDLATRLNNLANLYKERGQYEQAEPLYQRAVAIGEKTLGPEHPDLAIWLNNLANLYADQGHYKQAEPLYQRALAISEKTLGPEHPSVAIRLNNLAMLYGDQGKYEQAESVYLRAIAIGEKTLGPEHPDLATRLNNLASLYWRQGKYEQVEQLMHRVISIDEKALGPEHPGLATDLNNLAILYEKQGKYEQAEPLYLRAIAIREKVFGPEHSFTMKVRKYYEDFLRKRGEGG